MTRTRKLTALGLLMAIVLTCTAEDGKCDVIGDVYDLGATMFSTAGGGAFIDDGPTSLTFDGTTKVLGNLVFGNAGDQVMVQETQVQTGDEFVVTIFVFATDAAGNFTTWAADGTTFDNDGDPLTPEVPFEIAQFDIATGNGGVDTLDVNTGGDTYTFVESEALIIGIDAANAPSVFTFGLGSGATGTGGPTGNLSGGVALNSRASVSHGPTSLLRFQNLDRQHCCYLDSRA